MLTSQSTAMQPMQLTAIRNRKDKKKTSQEWFILLTIVGVPWLIAALNMVTDTAAPLVDCVNVNISCYKC